MARMKKFTRGQQDYVNSLQSRVGNQACLLGDIKKERDRLKEELEDVVNKSVVKLAEADADRDKAKQMHRDLLNAVEDFLMAEQDKQLKDRQYNGTLGRLGDLHTEHAHEVAGAPFAAAPRIMKLSYNQDDGEWKNR